MQPGLLGSTNTREKMNLTSEQFLNIRFFYILNKFCAGENFGGTIWNVNIFFGTILTQLFLDLSQRNNLISRNNLDVFICLCVHLKNCTESSRKRSNLINCVVEKQIKSPIFSNTNKKIKSFYTKRSYQTSLTMRV